jgi:carotenoid 1,2-hydratase
MAEAAGGWAARPDFTVAPPPGGYCWWYVDGLSEDGETGIVLIALVGNPFSPFFARARRAGAAPPDPLRYTAMNAVLYRGRRKLWTFTERELVAPRTAAELRVGPNEWRWEGGALTVRFDERSPLLGAGLRGTARLEPARAFDHAVALDAAGRHGWWPVAPRARIEVELEAPRLRLRGRAYHDMNAGRAPLEDGFRSWQWCHAALGGFTEVHYDVVEADGRVCERGWRFSDDGAVAAAAPGAPRPLGRSRWGIARSVRLAAGDHLRRRRTLESSPFYARTLLAGELGGERAAVIHESLDLTRFRRASVRALFYLRMRREAAWAARPPLGLLARLRR